ncbi:hypothetical protein BGX33_004996 [Mortierella sp. NVP41]|nr:hypothetical protein BGX33_004996 [Mortierella sp. NVP41]
MSISNYAASLALPLTLSLPAIIHAQRVVGYYGQAAGGCPDYPSFEPKDLPVELYTHLNFAFALIDDQGLIASQEAKEIPKYQQANNLKKKKPSLRAVVTVGGRDMDMAHYSTIVSTPGNRRKFINSAMAFRGGHPEDRENFVLSLKEMRAAANAEMLQEGQERLILSIALPGGPFHGDSFLIPKLAPFVDWFNIMAYNLHGQWESQVFCGAPLNDPASEAEYNGYSLVQAIESIALKTVDPQKFNLALSLSAVTFTLKDKSKTMPGAPANGPGREGCQEKGAMAYFEASKLVSNYHGGREERDSSQRRVTQPPQMDELSRCMFMVLDQDQWIGFDTPETFVYKVDYIKKYGFGGVSIWSMDSDTADHVLTRSIYNSLGGESFASSSSASSLSSSSPSSAGTDDHNNDKDAKAVVKHNGMVKSPNAVDVPSDKSSSSHSVVAKSAGAGEGERRGSLASTAATLIAFIVVVIAAY